MLSAISKWIRALLNEDELCKAETHSLALQIMGMSPEDPDYAASVDQLRRFIKGCQFLRDRDDYQDLIESFVVLGQNPSTLTAA